MKEITTILTYPCILNSFYQYFNGNNFASAFRTCALHYTKEYEQQYLQIFTVCIYIFKLKNHIDRGGDDWVIISNPIDIRPNVFSRS